MSRILISGPAGAAKSQLARTLLEGRPDLHAVADFTAIWAAMTLVQRGPDGRYPERTASRILSLVEYTRGRIIDEARRREFGFIVTNSDGDPDRRRALLERMGPGATERVVDPGEDVIRARLADPMDGALSAECFAAMQRWYRRKG